MPKTFVFEFDVYDNQYIGSFPILKEPNGVEDLLEAFDKKEKGVLDFDDMVEEIESEYGIHDLGFNPRENIWGYSSYEVEEDKIIARASWQAPETDNCVIIDKIEAGRLAGQSNGLKGKFVEVKYHSHSDYDLFAGI